MNRIKNHQLCTCAFNRFFDSLVLQSKYVCFFAYVEDDVLKGVYCYSKSGFGIILAERTIDATGDGDVSALAGVPFEKRDVKELQPTTVVFGISNVDTNKFLNYWRSNPKVFYNIFQQRL